MTVLFKKFKKGNCPYCNGPMKIRTVSSYEMDMENGIPSSFNGIESFEDTLICKSCGREFKEGSIHDTFEIDDNFCYEPVIDMQTRKIKHYADSLRKKRKPKSNNNGVIAVKIINNPFGGKK